MSNGELIKELHDLSEKDPKNVPAYSFRQITLQAVAKLLDEADDRKEILKEVHRILKPNGLLSVYPMHRDLREVKEEIESINFYLESEYSGTLLSFSGVFVSGQILNFGKEQA